MEKSKMHNPRQVNNLRIRYVKRDASHFPWKVWSPDGRLLEEFQLKADAVMWAEKTKDFVRR